jgi:hypothetical protein
MTMADGVGANAAAILEAMNDAIRAARFDDLEMHSAKLETILVDLSQVDDGTLENLRHLARRNADCLEAAAQGLRAGRRRLVEIAAAERADTYDRTGARKALSLQLSGRRL